MKMSASPMRRLAFLFLAICLPVAAAAADAATRPIQFGVQIAPEKATYDDIVAAFQAIEAAGYDSAWLNDHFIPIMGDKDQSHFESWTLLAALAAQTQRIRLGILVTGNTYRHPAVLAKMATTVDHISRGRLEFGLGAAWHTYEHQAFAIPFYTTGERLERLEEAAQVIKLLWTQPRPKFQGRYYQLDEPPYNPPNVQQPHPPILIGGSGERRTLRTVARYADATNVSGTPDDARRKFEVLEGHCREVGRDYSQIRRTVQLLLFLTDDPGFQQRGGQGGMAFRRVGEEEARRSVLLGSVEDV